MSFILFDVYMPQKDIWLTRDAVESIAKTFAVDAVPVVLKGSLQDAVEYVKQRPSSTMGTAPMEGLVCKPAVDVRDRMGRRVIVKVKTNDFTA